MAGRVVVTSASAMALSCAAFAAEPAPPPPPPPPAWTGVYLGVNAGGTWSSNDTIGVTSLLAFANPAADATVTTGIAGANGATAALPVNSGGFIGGGQIGYNYQFNNNLVAGIEADIQGLSNSNKSNTLFTSELIQSSPFADFANTALNVSNSLHYLGTVRGRLGFLITPNLLIFEDAGLAYGGVRANTAITQVLTGPDVDTINAPYFANGSASAVRAGWTAGGGAEWMFSPHWTLRAEYLYYNLGSLTYSNGLLVNVVTPPGGIVPAGGIWNSIVSQSHARFQGNIVRAAINFHFN